MIHVYSRFSTGAVGSADACVLRKRPFRLR